MLIFVSTFYPNTHIFKTICDALALQIKIYRCTKIVDC